MNRYVLLSAIAQNAKTPDTFKVPGDPERRQLRAGDSVKLMFASADYRGLDENHRWVERMWVRIDHVSYPTFQGILDTQPFQPDAFGLNAGDPVTFNARHIIACHLGGSHE